MATPTSRRPTTSGVLPKTQTVKSSTMRGASSPCQSVAAETHAEPGKARSGWVRGHFCILAPEINGPSRAVGNYAEAGVSDMPGQPGRERPTDVTAAMKDMNNRARSVAAGVVSGAGWCQPVLETPHFDESAPSRTRPSLDPMVFGVKRRRLWVSLQQGS